MIEYTVCQVLPMGTEDPLSSGHFEVGREVGREFSGVVLFPDEESARLGAVEYARKLQREGFPVRFIVRRTETAVVWDGDGHEA